MKNLQLKFDQNQNCSSSNALCLVSSLSSPRVACAFDKLRRYHHHLATGTGTRTFPGLRHLWSRSLVPVCHISGPGLSPGPGQHFWSRHTVTINGPANSIGAAKMYILWQRILGTQILMLGFRTLKSVSVPRKQVSLWKNVPCNVTHWLEIC